MPTLPTRQVPRALARRLELLEAEVWRMRITHWAIGSLVTIILTLWKQRGRC